MNPEPAHHQRGDKSGDQSVDRQVGNQQAIETANHGAIIGNDLAVDAFENNRVVYHSATLPSA